MLRHVETDKGVTGLVIGGELLLGIGHHHRAPLGAHHDLVLGILEFGHRDDTLVAARSQQGGLIDQIGKIGTGEAGRATRDHARVNITRQRHVAHMDLEDFLAADNVGIADHDFAVEPARTHQRRIEHVGTIGRGDQDHAFIGLEPVHLDEKLVQSLFALIIAAANTGTARAANGIDLVDEDDAGRILLGLFEHVADAAGADTDEHFNEVRTGNREEGHIGLAGDGAGQQGLAGTRRANEQNALGDLAAEALEFARILEEFDDFLQLFLGFIDTGDIVKRLAAMGFGQQAGLRFAEAHRAAASAALHLAHEEYPHPDQQQEGEVIDQDIDEEIAISVDRLDINIDAGFAQNANRLVVLRRQHGLNHLAGAALGANCVALNGRRGDFIAFDPAKKFRIGHLAGRCDGFAGTADKLHECEKQHEHHGPNQDISHLHADHPFNLAVIVDQIWAFKARSASHRCSPQALSGRSGMFQPRLEGRFTQQAAVKPLLHQGRNPHSRIVPHTGNCQNLTIAAQRQQTGSRRARDGFQIAARSISPIPLTQGFGDDIHEGSFNLVTTVPDLSSPWLHIQRLAPRMINSPKHGARIAEHPASTAPSHCLHTRGAAGALVQDLLDQTIQPRASSRGSAPGDSQCEGLDEAPADHRCGPAQAPDIQLRPTPGVKAHGFTGDGGSDKALIAINRAEIPGENSEPFCLETSHFQGAEPLPGTNSCIAAVLIGWIVDPAFAGGRQIITQIRAPQIEQWPEDFDTAALRPDR